ncbi:MAG: hypothetical protein IH624_20085 [Phycisphaerae bacterium]|nr:hypothetical protein [Phycisphaerae bacterium]
MKRSEKGSRNARAVGEPFFSDLLGLGEVSLEESASSAIRCCPAGFRVLGRAMDDGGRRACCECD